MEQIAMFSKSLKLLLEKGDCFVWYMPCLVLSARTSPLHVQKHKWPSSGPAESTRTRVWLTQGGPLFENTESCPCPNRGAWHLKHVFSEFFCLAFSVFALSCNTNPVFEEVVSAPGCSWIGNSRAVRSGKPSVVTCQVKRLQLCFLWRTYFQKWQKLCTPSERNYFLPWNQRK